MASSSTATATSAADASSSSGSSSNTTPALSVLYVTVKPLTDTFTPPASCGEMHLTQLSSPGYEIWLNEPQPVTQSQFGDCYPPGFIDGYTSGRQYVIHRTSFEFMIKAERSIYGSSSSIAPMFSPMVCPQGWSTAATWTNGYIACCASGFLFHPPDTTVDKSRPGYGGTCYSNFEAGQTAKVTVYNSASVTATIDWIASGTTDQAYAHPIDGYQLAVATSTSSAVQSVAETQSASPTSSADASSSSRISGGAIAGAVIGSLAGLALILLAVFFFARRYQRRNKPPPSFAGDEQFQEQQHQQQQQLQYQQQVEWNKDQMTATSPSTGYIQSPYPATATDTFDNRTPPYSAAPRYELGSQEPGELDSGWAGRELDAGNEKHAGGGEQRNH